MTLRSLIDIHTPFHRMRRSSQCWFDAECRDAKRPHARSNVRIAVNRLLERCRCLLGSPSLARNVVSFSRRRPNTGQLRSFASCSSDARQLWNEINKVIKPPTASQFTYSASDLRCTSLVRLTRFAPKRRRRSRHVL